MRKSIFVSMENDVINQVQKDQASGKGPNGVDGMAFCVPLGQQGYGSVTSMLRSTSRFGSFDCWIHNAGAASAYGTIYKGVIDFQNGTWTLTME
jgi:hypothetical protein